MTKSLSESAAEILKASMNAGKEPMQTLPAQMDDLGGETNEVPGGDEVGKKAAAATKEAPKPGQVSAEGDKKMNSVKSSGLATPVVGNMNPSLGEETEEVFTEEESIEEAKQVDHAKTIANSLAATHPNFRVSSYNGDHGRAHVVHHKSDTRNFKNGEELMGPNIQLQHNHETNKVHMEMQGDYDNVPDRDEETHHPDKAHEAAHQMFKPAIDLIHTTDKKTTNEEVEQEISEEELAEAKKKMRMDMVAKHKGSMTEDVDALFNGESLSEEFRTKATTIFEAAVNSRVDAILEDMMTENDAVLAEAVEELKNQMSTQVDEYLNYVVEQWVEDNQVAIEAGLRAELVDDFIGGLKNLFAEHYIEIPDEKVDVAQELANRVAELEESTVKTTEEASEIIASLTEQLNAAKKNEAIRKICEGLTEVQIEKMKSLAEGVEFTTEGEFDNKLATIRENYFPSKTNVKSEVKALQETAVEEPEVAEIHGMMKHYVNAIAKTAPKA
jgi:hypothetical protein